MTTETMKNNLDQMGDAIDLVLSNHKIDGRCTGGTVTSQFIRFDFMVSPGTKNHYVSALSEEFALALGCNSVVVDRNASGWIVQVPKEHEPVLLANLLRQYRRKISPLVAVLGVDVLDGAPLLLRIPAADIGHVCIVGNDRKKLLRTICESLIITNSPADLRTIGYPADSHRWDYDKNGERWQALQAEIERRERTQVNHPMLAVAIPELAAANDWIIGNLLQRGASVGVHILAASSVPAKQSFRVMIEGVGQGRFVLCVGGQEIEFTGAIVGSAK